jgi:hypothetical protein
MYSCGTELTINIINTNMICFSCYRLDDGTCRMYYTGQGEDGSTAIGVAKISPGQGNEWVREQASITFSSVQD